MQIRKGIAGVALAASVAGGAVGGALLFSPALGVAQETPSPTTTEDGTTDSDARLGCGPGGVLLASAAEAIGIEETELTAALRDGQTIAEVAEENGVDVQTVIDALVADAEARLDQAVEDGHLTQAEADEKKANLAEHITAVVNGQVRLHGPAFGRGHGHWWGDRRSQSRSGDSGSDGSSNDGSGTSTTSV